MSCVEAERNSIGELISKLNLKAGRIFQEVGLWWGGGLEVKGQHCTVRVQDLLHFFLLPLISFQVKQH